MNKDKNNPKKANDENSSQEIRDSVINRSNIRVETHHHHYPSSKSDQSEPEKDESESEDEQKELNEEKLLRLKRLSHNLDEAITIPGTEHKIGIDPIIGLIPGGGDLIGGVLSIYIMHAGIRMGMPRAVIVRMFGNVALEFIIGCIPIIGDLFDAMWKSNQRNVKLIEDSVMSEEKNTIFGYFLIGVLIKILTGVILLGIVLLHRMAQ